ncbi:hypothetical protein ATCV1_z686L [Acanthocystis turfacea chlorella virus 1]|uniref:Uncharacterized protein z686L n=1 Tax=Chlorovirus heliozoae TaxID=322019 RepID=A7K9U6_9PHYC|nr:hypothetical protein ATCV1_z686L [Acanthocystis turfacea chlorella virus 1]ABT16820.1 hypothetical protein ATCV1_z686L [Acanthocystis turfacea chlorella virus 1]
MLPRTLWSCAASPLATRTLTPLCPTSSSLFPTRARSPSASTSCPRPLLSRPWMPGPLPCSCPSSAAVSRSAPPW